MNEDVVLGKNSLRFLYYRYKDSPYFSLSIISIIFVVCIILIFQIIIPQAQSWFSLRDEVIATQERIAVLRANQNFMNNLDRSLLNSQLQVATQALPHEKNFDSILDAISVSALNAGVSLGDFSFQIGNISSSSPSAQVVTGPEKNGLTMVEVTLTVASNIDGTKRFLKEVKEKLPLSEVVHVEGNPQATVVTLRFFQKNLSQISFKKSEPIIPVSDANRQLLQQLNTWQVSLPTETTNTPSGSTSGSVPLF